MPVKNTETGQKRLGLRGWFLLCPGRHIIAGLSLAVIAAYFALRSETAFMAWLYDHVVRRYHRAAAGLCDQFSFSVAAVLIALVVIVSLGYLIFMLVRLIRGPARAKNAYRLLVFLLTLFLAIYAGFCLLWGVYYYTAKDFRTQSGLETGPVSTEQLKAVTQYFADLVNQYGAQVHREENGLFGEDLNAIFAESETLYSEAEGIFPFLAGEDMQAKPFLFSRAMSYIGFTGFFFPFTGEANINIDSPACLIPSTIAHELAHQRGIAAEDEANFAAVVASLAGGSTAYRYSASLLAYIHLGNALYSADREAWSEVYSSLSGVVRADLSDNNAYWEQFETPVSGVSDTVYTGFLQSYGQTLGLKSYGACVDLLVAYYYDSSIGGD